MFSLGNNADDGVLREIAAVQRDLDELKGAQAVGAANLNMQLIRTADGWDVNTTVPASDPLVWWEVVFHPDHATRRPYTEFGFDQLVTPDSGFELFNMFPSPNYVNTAVAAYIVEYSNPGFNTVNVKLKFSMKADDSGTLSWSVIR